MLLSLLISNPFVFLIVAVPLLYSVIIHEVAHGWMAYLFGDDTARTAGRLSFNPVVHIDPMGTLALLIVGFGWAKPVPVNYRGIKNIRAGLVMISLAGCLANFLLAFGAAIVLKATGAGAGTLQGAVLRILIRINVLLCALNLIPIPPLDGSKVLMGVLPREAQRQFVKIEPYGFLIIIGLLVTGLIDPIIGILFGIIRGLINFVV